ncbi:HlyD family efflux transporter periplasmic adaptor subunit [Streptomyces sp. NRRL B-24484]|uniref:HlyD family efflux transporter periplasmic adaptor subunit n=1 Tax=Streptomyces sp. NRRL B-24484 TaxID=1463833 RepID=UPI0004C04E33|nr:HlyD family efflux transporter periplasmic adaptor subunit [Streptomyces sp. NRRL B-24484]
MSGTATRKRARRGGTTAAPAPKPAVTPTPTAAGEQAPAPTPPPEPAPPGAARTAEPTPATPATPATAAAAGRAAAVLEPGLDQPVRLVGARLSAAAAALLLAVGAGTAWVVLGTLPHTVALPAVVAHGTAPATVRAEQAGTLVRLLVSPGERVAAGQAVAVVRGTDGRQSEVRADRAGTVSALAAGPGGLLAPGAPVLTLDPAGLPLTVRLFATDPTRARELRPGRTVLVPVPGGAPVRAVITAVDPLPARADSLDGTLPVALPGLPAGAAPVWTAYAELPPAAQRSAAALPGPLPVTVNLDLGARHPYQAVLGKGVAR